MTLCKINDTEHYISPLPKSPVSRFSPTIASGLSLEQFDLHLAVFGHRLGVFDFEGIQRTPVFTARCTLVQSAVLQSHVVCLSVRPSVCNVGGL